MNDYETVSEIGSTGFRAKLSKFIIFIKQKYMNPSKVRIKITSEI